MTGNFICVEIIDVGYRIVFKYANFLKCSFCNSKSWSTAHAIQLTSGTALFCYVHLSCNPLTSRSIIPTPCNGLLILLFTPLLSATSAFLLSQTFTGASSAAKGKPKQPERLSQCSRKTLFQNEIHIWSPNITWCPLVLRWSLISEF